MFGYVIPLKPELKVKEFEIFKAYYCGLCRSIKNHFGNIPRMALNYDMTFLAILLDGLNNEQTKTKQIRCIVHPTIKKNIVFDNFALEFASNMNVSLVYFKLLDDFNDDKDFKSRTLSIILKPYKSKFSSSVADLNEIINVNLNKLYALENDKNFYSIDEISHPFSTIVGKILELYPNKINNDCKETREILFSLGYSLGKWIYLIDALDDLQDDIINDKFNPINYLFNKTNLSYDKLLLEIQDRIEFSILSCACNCKEALELLNISKNKEILENIINLGMMDKYTKVIHKCNCNNSKGSDSNESI